MMPQMIGLCIEVFARQNKKNGGYIHVSFSYRDVEEG